jgi:hypothetical protein
MSLDRDAATGPTEIMVEKQIDSQTGGRAVFHNGKEDPGKNSEKAGNCGDKAYFILKRTGKPGYGGSLRGSDFFPSFPSCTWERELICNGQNLTRQPLHQGLMPSDKKGFKILSIPLSC